MDGNRKMIAGAVTLVIGVVVSFLKADIPPNLLQLLQVVFGAFVVGNVGEWVAGAVTAKHEAAVDIAKFNAEASEPWDDEFAALQSAIGIADAGLSNQLTDIKSELATLKAAAEHSATSPDGDEKIEAKIAALQSSLDAFVSAPRPDYAAMVENLSKAMEEVKLSSAANRNALIIANQALSTIISKAGFDK